MRPAFSVHSFNRIANIDQIVDGLRAAGAPGSSFATAGPSSAPGRGGWNTSTTERLPHQLKRPHEIRVTDRAISWAAPKSCAFVQDDDVIPAIPPGSKPPSTTSPPNPARAIIGGFIGFQSFDPDPAAAVPFWGRSEFRYVHRVNIGPYFVRRTSYQQLVVTTGDVVLGGVVLVVRG